MAEVAAPQRLGGVERRVLAHRDERVLQRRAAPRVRVHVAGRHARHARAARPAARAAGCARGRRAGTGAAARPAGDPARTHRAGAAAWARRARRAARTRSGRPAPRRARARRTAPRMPETGALAFLACARARASGSGRGSTSRPRPGRAASGGDRRIMSISAPWIARSPSARAETANSIEPRHRVVVGQRQRRMAQLQCGGNQLVGQRCPVQEREGRVAVELDIGRVRSRSHSNTCSHPPRTLPCCER